MKKIRKIKFIFVICLMTVFFSNCEEDPFGNWNFALFSTEELLAISRAQYDEEIAKYRAEGKLITASSTGIKKQQYDLYQEVGENIKKAAETWLKEEGNIKKIEGYFWEFALVDDPTVNAWAMPGALIVFYTGILNVCQNDAGIAVVMGHEVAHALLNHAQQRISLGTMLQLSAAIVGEGLLGSELASLAINLGLDLTIALPNSRENELEADECGQKLMAIAGYNPDQAAPFWKRMDELGSGIDALNFLSTHPTSKDRNNNLQNKSQAAKTLASKYGVTSYKDLKPIPK